MPIVEVNGQELEFPDDMSQDEIKLVLQKKFSPQAETTAGQEIARPLARAARSAIGGVGSVLDIGGAAVPLIKQGMRTGLEKAGVDFMGQNTPYVPPSEGLKNLFDAATGGIAKPRNDSERIVDVAGEVLSGGGGMKALAKGGDALLNKLAPQTGAELASLAGAGAGSEIGRQVAPDNPIAPIIGGVLGGVGTVRSIESARKTGNVKSLDDSYFSKQATKILEKNIDPSKAQALRTQLEADKNLVLPDIGGDEVRALTRQVGKFKGGARNDIDKFFTDRDKAAGQRIANIINSKISGVDKYYGSLDELTSTRSAVAKDQYDNAFTKHSQMKMTPSLNKFVQDGRFQAALNEARAKNLINIEEPINSLRTMNAVYKRLRDKAGEAYRAGANEEATVYGDFAKDFVKRLDVEAPEYKKARNTFAGFSDMMEAQNMGKNYAKLTPEQINKEFKGLTKGEKDAFKIGVRESLQNEVMKTGATASEANKIFGKAMQRQQLKQILGDEFGDFSQKMRKEIRMNDSKFRITGGSRTDFNTIEDGQFIESAARAVRGGKVAITNEIINTIGDAIKNKYMGINPNNARILSKALTSNKEGIKILDDMIAKQKSPAQRELLKSVKKDYNYLLVPVGGQL